MFQSARTARENKAKWTGPRDAGPGARRAITRFGDAAKSPKALMAAGYDGLIVPEHLGEAGELIDSVVYLRKLIDEVGKIRIP